MSQPGGPIVFLDKDGTLVRDVPYNVDKSLLELEPEASPALKSLSEAGFRLVIVSNQSGVARGYFSEEAVRQLGVYLRAWLLAEENVQIDGFYYCPHFPQGNVAGYSFDCECRKPKPGLLLKAAHELQADLHDCWMVGDILNDVEAGNQAGCRTILLDNGHETEWVKSPSREPDFTVQNLMQAAAIILAESGLPTSEWDLHEQGSHLDG